MRKAKIMTQSTAKINPGKELQQFVTAFYNKYAAKYGLTANCFDPEYVSDCLDLEQETDLDLSTNFQTLLNKNQKLSQYQLIVLTIPKKGNTFTVSLVTRKTIKGQADDMLNGYGSPYTNAKPDKVLAQAAKTLSGKREETLLALSDLAQ